MAFAKAAGYQNLPNGNFVPVIYSKKAQIAFRKNSVVQAITNTDYFGEIADYGDTVKVIKEPQMTVRPYVRGQQITAEDIDDEEFTLIVDKANYFAFKVDDIEKKQAHHNWESLASDNSGYQLRDTFDSEVLTYMTTQVPAAQTTGSTGTPTPISNDGTDESPVGLLNIFDRQLNLLNVPYENRWFVADPVFYEKLQDENSKLINHDYVSASENVLRNGRVFDGKLRNFTMYQSNNLPFVGTGPLADTGANGGWVMAGHISSTATAEQINKVESYRDPDSFADVVRGLHMYGRKLLRTESIVAAVYQS